MLFFQLREPGNAKILFLLYDLHDRSALCKKRSLILHLSLLTDDQERFPSDLKIRLRQCIADEFRFAAFQKSIDHIYRFHADPSLPIF